MINAALLRALCSAACDHIFFGIFFPCFPAAFGGGTFFFSISLVGFGVGFILFLWTLRPGVRNIFADLPMAWR